MATDYSEVRSNSVAQLSAALATANLPQPADTLLMEALAGVKGDTTKAAATLVSTVGSAKNLKSPDAQLAAVKTVTASMPNGMTSPDQVTADHLWRAVVYGLVGVLTIALVGLLVLLALGKTADAIVTVFTATLTGVLGLFVVPPAKSAQGSSAANS
jgi:hypothetical protein